jgi:hypothetical protein
MNVGNVINECENGIVSSLATFIFHITHIHHIPHIPDHNTVGIVIRNVVPFPTSELFTTSCPL